MSGLEPVKAAGAWAWKLLENPFIDFLKRRLEDAKSDSEKAQYLEARWNEFDWGKAVSRVTILGSRRKASCTTKS